MKKEFIVQRQGKTFVLYAGLLDLGHQQGLKSIETQIVQAPTAENHSVAICMASVVLEQGGVERRFTGIGDAAPNNVAPAMHTCLLRMAETRAKARALRDAVNIGVAAFEELGEEDVMEGAASARSYRPERPPRQATAAQAESVRMSPPAASMRSRQATEAQAISENQKSAIQSLSRRLGLTVDAVVAERYGDTALDALSDVQASELIKALNDRNAGRAHAA